MEDLQTQLVNMGYLRASVDAMTKSKNKKTDVTYILHPGDPYFIRNIDYVIQDSLIASLLQMDQEENRGLKTGMQFNVENLDAERKRITRMLSNMGYYRFNKEYITFLADSVADKKEIDLVLVLRKQRDSKGQEKVHDRYMVRAIHYASGNPEDSIIHLRPGVLRKNTFIKEGDYYSADDLQNTYTHFGRLGAVRYTNITWQEQPDSTQLDCMIQISTNKPSTISFQPEGTNTSGDLGVAASLTYQNRNLFKGAENLSIELRGAYEAIKSLEGYSNHDFIEYSLETKLSFPRFIFPFLSSSFRRRVLATSEVSLMYDMQNRPHKLDFAIRLNDFSIEMYPAELGGGPKRYASDVTLFTADGDSLRDTILVNKPLSIMGWKVYQLSYNEAMGGMSESSVLELVRDPWLPYVYVGIFMMLLGAVLLFFKH